MNTGEYVPYLLVALLVLGAAIWLRRFFHLFMRPISLWLESRRPLPVVGGLYSVADQSGAFFVAKVLAIDVDAVHVRLYQNRFAFRPERVDPAWLWLGETGDGEWSGISHFALSYPEFSSARPILISTASVTDEEREACRAWHRAGRWIAEA